MVNILIKIIFEVLKKVNTYISILFTLLLSVSILPYHAFHEHIADAHVRASVLHLEKEHHCILDTFHCQKGIGQSCEHKHHIGSPVTKCFTCAYHFINVYQINEIKEPAQIEAFDFLFSVYACSGRIIFQAAQQNKGPPEV